MLRLICLLVCCTVFVRGDSEILRDDSASESSLEIALVQFTAENGNKTANLQQIEYYAQQAAENGSSLLVFPELSLVGYSIIAETNIVHLAEPQNGPSMQRIQEIAQQYNINIAYGYMELGSTNDCNQKLPPFQNNIYDSYAIISSSGELILNYRKTHLALGAEERLFTRGGVIGPVVEVNGVKIGVMICIEVYTPEIARYLGLEGAQMILAPTANAYPACDPSEVTKGYYNVPAYVMVPARAGENHIPVCYVNYYDPDNVYFTFNGMTVLYGPEGTLMAWGGYNSSTVIYNSVPIKLTTPQSGRRPNLYSGICSPNSYSYCSDEANCIPVSPYP